MPDIITKKKNQTNNRNRNNIIKKSLKKKNTYKMASTNSIPEKNMYKNLKKTQKGEWVYQYYNSKDDDTVSKSNKKRCMCIDYKSNDDFKTYDRCPRNVIDGSDFCELHQNCKSYLRNFLSGSEPEFNPQLWSDPYIEGSHNCYSYFLNRQVKAVREKCEEICLKKHKKGCPKKDSDCTDLKPQPYDFKLIQLQGSDKNKERIYKCPQMQRKILGDNPSLIPVAFNEKCPNNYYKGAMVVDTDNTYHFYRSNNKGMWDHKPGISPITDKDASGRKIYVPHFADRDYTKVDDDDEAINYTGFCGYYCIPTNKTVHKNLA